MINPQSPAAALLSEVNALAIQLRKLEGVPQASLSSGEFNILRLLSEQGSASVPQIARTRCTSRQNTQVTVNRLLASGCIEGFTNPAHRRSRLLRITETGHRLLSENSLGHRELLRRVDEKFSLNSLEASARLLGDLRQLIGEITTRMSDHTGSVEKPDASLHHEPISVSSERSEEEIPVSLL